MRRLAELARRLAKRGLAALALAGAAGAAAAQPLLLDDAQARVIAWPALTMLSDPGKQLTLEGAQAAAARFAPPTTAPSTLVLRKDAVWLRIPLAVSAHSDGRWLLDIDYAVLNRIDLHLVDAAGRVVRQARLGNLQPYAQRSLPSRAPAIELELAPGAAYTLWLRVETLGAMIVPISLSKPAAYLERSLAEQLLQGLLTGLGLCLLLYSLAQWLSLREALLLKYAVLIAGGLLFSVLQFGIGAQYLWTDNFWLETHVAGIAALTAAAGTFLTCCASPGGGLGSAR
jgi:hypothetical protein